MVTRTTNTRNAKGPRVQAWPSACVHSPSRDLVERVLRERVGPEATACGATPLTAPDRCRGAERDREVPSETSGRAVGEDTRNSSIAVVHVLIMVRLPGRSLGNLPVSGADATGRTPRGTVSAVPTRSDAASAGRPVRALRSRAGGRPPRSTVFGFLSRAASVVPRADRLRAPAETARDGAGRPPTPLVDLGAAVPSATGARCTRGAAPSDTPSGTALVAGGAARV